LFLLSASFVSGVSFRFPGIKMHFWVKELRTIVVVHQQCSPWCSSQTKEHSRIFVITL